MSEEYSLDDFNATFDNDDESEVESTNTDDMNTSNDGGKKSTTKKKLLLAGLASLGMIAIALGIGLGISSKRSTTVSSSMEAEIMTLQQCLDMDEYAFYNSSTWVPTWSPTSPLEDDEDTQDTYSFFPLMDNIPSDEEETGGETDDLAGIVSLYEDESGGEDVRRKLRVRKSMKEESKRHLSEQCVQTIEAWIDNTCAEDDPDTAAVTYSAQLSSESEEKKTLSNDVPLTSTQDSPAKRLRRLSSKLRSLEEVGVIAEEDYTMIMAAGKCAKKRSSKSMKPTPTSAPTLIETYNLSNSAVVEIPNDDITEPISLTLDKQCDSIRDLAVTVSIEYPQVGHLSIGLFSPDGTNATIMNQPSGDSDKSSGDKSDLSKLNSLTFFDSADFADPDTIGAGVDTSEDVPQGNFYSVGNGAKDELGVTLVGNPNSLTDFKGNKKGEGTWSLFVLNNGKRTGTIHSVELTIECAVTAPPPVCPFCPDGLDDPDIKIPVDDMPTCQNASDFAATLTSTDPDCETLKLAEPTCCPPPVTTTQATITTPETTTSTTDATTTAIATTTDSTTTAIATTRFPPSCIVAPMEAAEGCVEAQSSDLNSCNFGRDQFDTITTDGTTYCGSLSSFTSTTSRSRDFDYYIFTVPSGGASILFEYKLTGLGDVNFKLRKLVDDNESCGSINEGFGAPGFFVDNDSSSGLIPANDLPGGRYQLWVFPDTFLLECGTRTNFYEISVKFTPID